MSSHHEVLIVGGGTAGITTAASLRRLDNPPQVTVIEPRDVHYYQPLWTLVGGGVVDRSVSVKPMRDLMPDGVDWIQDKVASFEPEQNQLTLASGETVTYEHLVVAAGIQLDWNKIEGLKDALGKGGVTSNYHFDLAPYTWECVQNLQGGRAIFTFPSTPIKCAGAPQKIMWLTEHWLVKNGLRDKVEVVYGSATAGIFGIPRYAKTLGRLADERNIVTHFRNDLVAIKADSKEAVFRNLDTGEEQTLGYDMIHVTPPQSAPDFIKQSPLANEAGWVDVDMYTTRHTRFENVWALGDASSLPCSKTAAAVRKQAPVLVENLDAARHGRELTAAYDGYASCPLVTGYGRLILAEFGYGGKILETMPFDQSRERYSMFFVKAHMLPDMYWHGMLRGRW